MYPALTYGYSNARIRSLSGQLLDRGKLERLAKAESVEAAISQLAESAYGAELSELSLSHEGASLVDLALGRHLSRVCRKILNMTPSSSRMVVEDLLGKWDVQDIKAILIGKHHKKTNDEIRRALTGCGTLNPEELEAILSNEGLPNTVRFIGGSALGRSLQSHIGEYERDGDILPILTELDRICLLKFEDALFETEDRLVKSLIMADMDARNLMTILRCRADGTMSDERIRGLLVPSGTLGAHELEPLLSAKDWKTAVSRVGSYDLSAALDSYSEDQSLVHFEDALGEMVMKRAYTAYRTSVLSLSVIIGFLYVKEDETRKIRAIMCGKEYGFPAEKIREMAMRRD